MSIKIAFCYAHEDEKLLDKLKIHLKPLQQRGTIDMWDDRMISAGVDWRCEVDERLNMAHLILFLVSPDFLASDYIYSVEINKALERQSLGKVHIIPIILRPAHWEHLQALSNFQVLPTGGIPLTSSSWHDLDEALFNVVAGIQRVIPKLLTDAIQASSVINNNNLISNKNESKTHILIVDDNNKINIILMKMLSYTSLNAFSVNDGKEALNFIVSGRKVDIILLDINMGRMGGLELIDQLQAKGLHIPIILVTAAQPYVIEMILNDMTLNKDIKGVLEKPLTFQELLSAINSVLETNRFIPPKSDNDLIE